MPESSLYSRVHAILNSARERVARTVDTTQVLANWLVGREIVEEQQKGEKRAGYGENLMRKLSAKLQKKFGNGYSYANLKLMRQFYLEYLHFLDALPKGYTPRSLLEDSQKGYAVCSQSSRPGLFNSNLCWSHYRALLRVDKVNIRSFYEIESINNSWAARELERQINSLLYERLALSKDKRGVMKLSTKGQVIEKPSDVFKEPVVIEFLGLPESPKLVESNLEQALISNLQNFLLEMGKGFAFVARQERLTLDGDHFYVDLVFYHTVLKCYVLIDLKTGKLNHGDLGQLQLYVNYFDMERRSEGDAPTLGLILCADKNDAMVRYLLGDKKKENIFTSRYKLNLPTVAELKAEIKRELKELKS